MLKELEKNIDKNNNEFEQYKAELRNDISEFINKGLLEQAQELIMQYETLAKSDVDIISMKAIISIIQGRLDAAEDMIYYGLTINDGDFDLLFNMGYVYKLKGCNDLAVYFYKKAYHLAQDQDIKNELEHNIKELNGNLNIKVLIGSPIHQKVEILKEFLISLGNLKKSNIDLHFYLIDDNQNEKSSKLLEEYSYNKNNILVQKSNYKDQYICNNETHFWHEELIWKVASFKDSIIEYAKDHNFDYLFLIDSDLVLHPNTLEHLISTGKDIVSEIFWTKWDSSSHELPQVWLKDQYIQYIKGRSEKITQDEASTRHQQFISMLKQPGIYEVGGLGACTVISKYALHKGVNFKEIKNISFWGEDRHFCIRASALGIPLYVDTHYPAYHIYRESDLQGIDKFPQQNAGGTSIK